VSTVERVDCYVFHFDLIGVVDSFLADPEAALDQLRAFQRSARRRFPFSRPNSYIVTLADNVWCRINASQPGTPSLVLDFAGEVAREARIHEFPRFFGAVTRGIHEFDVADRTLASSGSIADLTEQHVDMTSEPHIRAAVAEKRSGQLHRVGKLPVQESCVWVSREVVANQRIEDLAALPDAKFRAVGEWFDLSAISDPTIPSWPFNETEFRAIAAA